MRAKNKSRFFVMSICNLEFNEDSCRLYFYLIMIKSDLQTALIVWHKKKPRFCPELFFHV